MRVVGIKMSTEPEGIKVLYEKKGRLYIRTGTDGFSVGKPARAPMASLMNKWGFRKVENPPEFRDADELMDGLTSFGLKPNGTVSYSG